MRGVLLVSALMLAVSAQTYVAPNVIGTWCQPCEVIFTAGQQSGISLEYIFGPGDFYQLTINIFANNPYYCSAPTATLQQLFTGTYSLSQPNSTLGFSLGGDGNSSVALLTLTYTSKQMTLYTGSANTILSIACPEIYSLFGNPTIFPVSQNVFEVGCPELGIGNNTSCPIEYDIVETFFNGQSISQGSRVSSSGDASPLIPCTPSQTPTTFGYVLTYTAPTPTPTSSPTPTPTPTNAPSNPKPTPTPSSTSPNNTTPTPTSSAISTLLFNAGAIARGIIGGLVGLALLV